MKLTKNKISKILKTNYQSYKKIQRCNEWKKTHRADWIDDNAG